LGAFRAVFDEEYDKFRGNAFGGKATKITMTCEGKSVGVAQDRYVEKNVCKTCPKGFSCANQPPGLPKYCCNDIIPNPTYAETCECNPAWAHKECVCRAYLTKMPCHQCMVHLPATNRWTKSFTKKELYGNCADCVDRCKAEFEKGECSQFMGKVFSMAFPANPDTPEEVLCTSGYLKDQLMKEEYPTMMKRALYKAPKLRADDDYIQPSDWPVAGVGAKR